MDPDDRFRRAGEYVRGEAEEARERLQAAWKRRPWVVGSVALFAVLIVLSIIYG